MRLLSLYLKDFRLYSEAFFEFDPHLNTICGSNARGKTSLLEAIYFLMTGRSFRNAQVSDMIRYGASYFFLEATFLKNNLEQKLKISCDGSSRKIIYNTTAYPSSSSLLGLLQGVVLSPDDVALVKGGPAVRREYLDLQIAQVDPFYVHHLTRYNRAMRQRNHLLRARSQAAIESWEHEMATSSAYISQQRALASGELQDLAQGLNRRLTGEEVLLNLSYKTSLPVGIDLEAARHYYLTQHAKNRRREMELGFTLVGPHKDDLIVALGDKEARFFASEGQQRSCVAALKFAEWERMRRVGEENPILMLDDVGTSLDEDRKGRLLDRIQNTEFGIQKVGQVFLTSTTSLPIPGTTIKI